MLQQQSAQNGLQERAFGEKSDKTLWIALSVGFAVIGALGTAHWMSHAEKVASKPAVTVQAKSASAGSVFRCADGRVSFTPCS